MIKKETENNLLFQLIVDGIGAGVWDWIDVSKDKEWWSPKFYDLLGFENLEIEASIQNFKNLLHPEDHNKTFLMVENHFKNKSPFELEYRLKTKSGNYRWFKGNGKAQFDSKGKPIRMVGSIIDIHDKKLIELKLKEANKIHNTILEATMAGYWDWHIEEDYEYMSPTFKKMFGYDDNEVPNTPSWWQKQIHPEDLPKALKTFEKHVESKGKIPYDNEVRYFHKDGSIVWVYCRGEIIEWDNSGKPIRMVGSHVNITPLKNTEELVSKKVEELESMNKELQQFAYVASHDLQEPLRVITSYLELLNSRCKGQLDEKGEKYISRVIEASKRMKALINDLLLLSRVDSNPINLEKTNLNETINNVIKNLQISIKENEATINFSKLPVLRVDPIKIHQLFQNLISNAIKFCDNKTKPIVDIKCEKHKREFVFSVSDNGIGIDKKYFERIFIIFQRLHTREEYSGTGIGLALCKKIIKKHGGKIWVESSKTKGSTFYFTIPTTD